MICMIRDLSIVWSYLILNSESRNPYHETFTHYYCSYLYQYKEVEVKRISLPDCGKRLLMIL